MPSFSSLKQLEAYIQSKINETLLNEVSDTVKQTESESVKDEIYGKFHPSVYQRRGDDGGLSDVNNMDSTLISDGVLAIENTTMTYPTITMSGKTYDSKNKDKLLTPLIVEGGSDNYDFPGDPYSQPRDFIQKTKAELARSGAHVEALKKGLNRRGVSVK